MNNLIIRDAKIVFRNFSGKPTKFSREGKRGFAVIIPPDDVEGLRNDGWNVKDWTRQDGEIYYYIPVAVSYGTIPPNIYLVTSKRKTLLDEDTISCLDISEIKHVDLTIRPYNWEVNGDTGVKAYVKTMYVTIEEDEFAEQYAYLDEDISRTFPTDEDELEVPFQ